MKTRVEKKSSRWKRGSVLGSIGAAIALIASALVPSAALAAPPQAGNYVGTSTAYTDATFSFDVDANGVMSNFNATSYCFDGMFTQPVIWAGGPSDPIEAGQPFNLTWEYNDDGFGTYYELQGVVNADGTATGTGRAGFLPSGTCGGSEFSWTAFIDGDAGEGPPPQGPEIILEKTGYYDKEIQNVGIMIRGEGFPADTDVTITIHQLNNNDERYNTTVRSNANGEVYDRYIGWLEHQTLNGNHRLTMTAEADGHVVSDDIDFRANPGGDGSFWYFDAREMSVAPHTVSQSQLSSEGVLLASDDMDGREDTAELVVNGKIVGEVPVTEIADQFGEVDYRYFSDGLPVGEHEIALRTVHVSGSMNPVTWERVAWDTLTVTEDPVLTEVTAATPNQVGNTVTIPSVTGVTYSDGSGNALSGSVTVSHGQVLTISATANDGYVLTDGVHVWTFEYEAPEPTEVTAAAPTQDGDTVTIPSVTGVTYVDGAGTVLSGDITLVDGESLAVTATADDGYVLADGVHEWTFTYEVPEPEPIEVAAAAPTRDGNTVTIPVVEGVTYIDAEGGALSDSVTLNDGDTLTVTVTANDGYVLADGPNEWSFTYETDDPVLVEVIAAEPTRGGNTVTIPVVEGVTYLGGSGEKLSGSVTLTENQTLTVSASADEGYVLADGAHEWSFTYEAEGPEPELVEVTADAPTQDGKTVTVPTVTGVTYVDGSGVALFGGVQLFDGETLTVTAVADEGYVLADGPHDWTFTYEADEEETEPVEVTADAPTQDGNAVTIPTMHGVTYIDSSGVVLSGSVTLVDGESLTVTATADDGYVLTGGTHEWFFTYEAEEEQPEPDTGTIPSTAPSEDDLDPVLEGGITVPGVAEAGASITIVIGGVTEGDEVGLWLFSEPVYLGTHTVDVAGTVTVTIPTDTALGDHRIAAWLAGSDTPIGWASITVTADDQVDDGEGQNHGDGTGSGDDQAPGTVPDNSAAPGLAVTGASPNLLAGLGILLLIAGATVVLVQRRRIRE